MVKWGDRKCFLLRQTLLRDPLKPDCTVAPAKMANDVLRAQAHFFNNSAIIFKLI